MLTFGWNPGEKSDFQSDMWGYVVNSYIKIQLKKGCVPNIIIGTIVSQFRYNQTDLSPKEHTHYVSQRYTNLQVICRLIE